jgi:hypothetical protein
MRRNFLQLLNRAHQQPLQAMADRRFFTLAAYRTAAHQKAGDLLFHARGVPHQLFAEIVAQSWAESAEIVTASDNLGTFEKNYRQGRWHGRSPNGFLVQ